MPASTPNANASAPNARAALNVSTPTAGGSRPVATAGRGPVSPAATCSDGPTAGRRYVAPSAADRRASAAVAWLTRRGLRVGGARELTVRGRRTGASRSVPVNVLDHGGARYVVSPRGETEWVRNLRAAGAGSLRRGRRVEPVVAVEVDADDRAAILRAYLGRWGWQVGKLVGGISRRSTDAELAAVADDFPVFRLVPAG